MKIWVLLFQSHFGLSYSALALIDDSGQRALSSGFGQQNSEIGYITNFCFQLIAHHVGPWFWVDKCRAKCSKIHVGVGRWPETSSDITETTHRVPTYFHWLGQVQMAQILSVDPIGNKKYSYCQNIHLLDYCGVNVVMGNLPDINLIIKTLNIAVLTPCHISQFLKCISNVKATSNRKCCMFIVK